MAQAPFQRCDFCKELNERTANFYCDGCNKYLCVQCKRDFHEKAPVLRNHNVVHIKKVARSVLMSTPVCCESHRIKCLHYCSNCNCFTCNECMTSSHNGHTTDTIKHIIHVYHKDARKIQKKLKAKLECVQRQLDAIQEEHRRDIKLEYYSYVEKVEKMTRELHGIVDNVKSESNNAASDHQKTQTSLLKKNKESLKNYYEYLSMELLEVENLLHEANDFRFLLEWKRYEKDAQTVSEMEEPHKTVVLKFSKDTLMREVIEDIDKRLKKR